MSAACNVVVRAQPLEVFLFVVEWCYSSILPCHKAESSVWSVHGTAARSVPVGSEELLEQYVHVYMPVGYIHLFGEEAVSFGEEGGGRQLKGMLEHHVHVYTGRSYSSLG